MESFCLLLHGNLVIKSSDTISHLHSRISNAFKNPIGWWCSTLTCWYSIHFAKYSTTLFFILGQKRLFLKVVTIFWYPGCPRNPFLRYSSSIISFNSGTLDTYNYALYVNIFSSLSAYPGTWTCYNFSCISQYFRSLCTESLIFSNKFVLTLLTIIVVRACVCLCRASNNLFSIHFICLISNSNSLRNDMHRLFLPLRWGWLNKYFKLKWYVNNVNFFPKK